MNRVIFGGLTIAVAMLGFALGYRLPDKAPTLPPPAAISPVTETKSSKPTTEPKPVSFTNSASDSTGTSSLAPNPKASLGDILKYPSKLRRLVGLRAYFERIPIAQFPALLADFKKKTSQKNQEAIQALFLVWVDRAPHDGAKYLKSIPAGYEQESLAGTFFRTWSRNHPKQAKEWITASLTGMELHRALKAFEERPQTREAILAISDPNQRRHQLDTFFTKRAVENPTQALKEAMALAPGDRSSAMYPVIGQWAKSDPLAAMQWVKNRKPEELLGIDGDLRAAIVRQTLEKDPFLAKTLAAEMSPGRIQSNYMDRIAARLLDTDLPSALAYVEDFNKQYPTSFNRQFYSKWFEQDPTAATEHLRRNYREEHFTVQPGYGSSSSGDSLTAWMNKDPAASAAFAISLPDAAHPELLKEISRAWIRQDGWAAAQWAESLPDGNTKNFALRQFGETWSRYDTTQSTAWLNSLPPDTPGHSAAVEGVAGGTIDNDPDAALSMVRSLSDESERMKVLTKVWKDWSRKNKFSAEDWLKNAPLSEGERNAIQPPK